MIRRRSRRSRRSTDSDPEGNPLATAPVAAPDDARSRSAEEIERDWFENVYQGDKQRQLTLRAGLTGMVIGAVMCVSNVYVGLKIGWSLGVSITSCILAFVFFQALTKMFRLKE